MIDNNKIGKYIRELRNKSKLTQEELSEKIFVSRQAVSNWETGKDAPRHHHPLRTPPEYYWRM